MPTTVRFQPDRGSCYAGACFAFAFPTLFLVLGDPKWSDYFVSASLYLLGSLLIVEGWTRTPALEIRDSSLAIFFLGSAVELSRSDISSIDKIGRSYFLILSPFGRGRHTRERLVVPRITGTDRTTIWNAISGWLGPAA